MTKHDEENCCEKAEPESATLRRRLMSIIGGIEEDEISDRTLLEIIEKRMAKLESDLTTERRKRLQEHTQHQTEMQNMRAVLSGRGIPNFGPVYFALPYIRLPGVRIENGAFIEINGCHGQVRGELVLGRTGDRFLLQQVPGEAL